MRSRPRRARRGTARCRARARRGLGGFDEIAVLVLLDDDLGVLPFLDAACDNVHVPEDAFEHLPGRFAHCYHVERVVPAGRLDGENGQRLLPLRFRSG